VQRVAPAGRKTSQSASE